MKLKADPKIKSKKLQIGDGPAIHCLAGSLAESRFVYCEVFIDRLYAQHQITLNRGDCVFDVGANVGMFSTFAANEAQQLTIFAFEPVPPIFELLQRNLECLSSDSHTLHLLPFGLSDQAGQHEIAFFPRSPANSTRYIEHKDSEAKIVSQHLRLRDIWNYNKIGFFSLLVLYPFRKLIVRKHLQKSFRRPTSFTVDFRTLNDIIESRAVDTIHLLKIDVEGSEFDVLSGLSDENWNRIQQIVIEVSPSKAKLVPQLTADLIQRGFANVNIESMGYDRFIADSKLPCNIYAVRQ